MHELYELKEKLIKELADYSENGKFSEDDAENIKNLSGAIDHLCNIIMDYEDEYSNAGGSYARGGGGGGNRGGGRSREGGRSYEGSYEGGSYARGRGRGARRDSMGRYSREQGYSRAEAMDDMADDIRAAMPTLPEDLKRDAQRFLSKLEQQM